MRISHQMLHQNSLNNMNQSLGRFEKAYSEASTGKQLTKPSDDPLGASKAMQLKSAIATNDQYERNTAEANLWLDETDQTVYSMVNVMQRVRELAVRGENGTLTPEDRAAVATEVEELTKQIAQFADSKVNGKDLFGKTETGAAPKTVTIGGGVNIEVNVSIDKLLGVDNNEAKPDEENLMTSLTNLSEGLRNGTDVSLETIDAGIERLLTVSAEVGAKRNRVESAESRMLDNTLQLKSMLTKIEDVDLAEAITKLKTEEAVYQASLAASAKIIQPSLMDFLR